MRSEAGESEGLFDLLSFPNPNALRRAARPGDGLRADRDLRCSPWSTSSRCVGGSGGSGGSGVDSE